MFPVTFVSTRPAWSPMPARGIFRRALTTKRYSKARGRGDIDTYSAVEVVLMFFTLANLDIQQRSTKARFIEEKKQRKQERQTIAKKSLKHFGKTYKRIGETRGRSAAGMWPRSYPARSLSPCILQAQTLTSSVSRACAAPAALQRPSTCRGGGRTRWL